MARPFGTSATVAVLLAAWCGEVAADPLADALKGRPDGICYDRVYSAEHLAKNPGQKTRAIRMSLQAAPDIGGATVRIMLVEAAGAAWLAGTCNWATRAGTDSLGGQLLDTFRIGPGLDCHAVTSLSGMSAEEGGDFVVDMRDGRSMTVHVPGELAAWSRPGDTGDADWHAFGTEDRVFRVDGAQTALCAQMNAAIVLEP
ncbi:MAG: hypothetical protein KF849_07955 [Rhizobiaceae bacterium]|nr:hypothetical protein [Rhizobiaceae bacterium]